MRRRELLAGIGVVVAGGTVTLGTGAVSSVRAEREITGRVVGDGSAYLQIQPGNDHGYAVENLDGQFRVNFANNPDGGDGLNPDAVSQFDDVFRINNAGPETLSVQIQDDLADVEFYFGNEIEDDSGDGDTVTRRLTPGGNPLRVGVRVDLRDATPAEVFGDDDTVTIVALDAEDNDSR